MVNMFVVGQVVGLCLTVAGVTTAIFGSIDDNQDMIATGTIIALFCGGLTFMSIVSP